MVRKFRKELKFYSEKTAIGGATNFTQQEDEKIRKQIEFETD
jgi:hypothetical protein